MTDPRRLLAIDLGTSTLKVGLIDEHARLVTSVSSSYPTFTTRDGAAEQRPDAWLDALARCVEDVHAIDHRPLEAIVLTGQMPTLVALDQAGAPIGHAVTWQDSRAHELVRRRLSVEEARRVYELAGTPIDGRYLVPMYLRRLAEDEGFAPSTLLSAKDYLYYVLTGRLVTDPSTASGFGTYSLATSGWSDELTNLWGIDASLLPEVVAPTTTAPLTRAGATHLDEVLGTPVFVGGADSLCAHHYVSARVPGAMSVIEGTSSVILAPLTSDARGPHGALVTPTLEAGGRAIELDLLSTGASIGWLSAMLERSPTDLEDLALAHPDPASSDLVFTPYLAPGEQGVLWRDDLRASISGITLSTSPADLALALYEGIAFETTRCLRSLGPAATSAPVCVVGEKGRHFGAALLGALVGRPVVALHEPHPALMGAALLAMNPAGVGSDLLDATSDAVPVLSRAYREALAVKAERYLATQPPAKDEP